MAEQSKHQRATEMARKKVKKTRRKRISKKRKKNLLDKDFSRFNYISSKGGITMLRNKSWVEQALQELDDKYQNIWGNLFYYNDPYPKKNELIKPMEYFNNKRTKLTGLIDYSYHTTPENAQIWLTMPGFTVDVVSITSSSESLRAEIRDPEGASNNPDFYIQFKINSEKLDGENIIAKFSNGLLKIIIPYRDQSKKLLNNVTIEPG